MASALLLGIDRLVLRVPNVPAATAFYRDVLGVEVVREGSGFTNLRLPDGKEMLLHNSDDLPAEAVFLLVEDVNDLYRRRDELRLKFAGRPTRVSRGFKATAKDPFGGVLLLIDRSLEEAGGDAGEDVRTPHALFSGVTPKVSLNATLLAELYQRADRTADDLPYTPQFEQIHAAYAESFPEPRPDRAETWRHLLNLRKRGDLPKLGAARSRPPASDDQTVALLREVLASEFGGRIGRRDRLPYSPEFDRISESFNRARSRQGQGPLAPHQLWRLVALIAK
jgi:catechol 2,3-dioxygenase-like lactoylglutathione lyase family enzyme